jgi:hypothetical protein
VVCVTAIVFVVAAAPVLVIPVVLVPIAVVSGSRVRLYSYYLSVGSSVLVRVRRPWTGILVGYLIW